MICAHEIAAYLTLIDNEWEEYKNIIPLQMSPFAIPTHLTVDYYKRWNNNILIRDKSLSSKDQLRKPNRAELEIALWTLVKKMKHDKTFFAKASRDGNLRDYNWKIDF